MGKSFDADFMINFAISLLEDAKINSSWKLNIPKFNIGVNFFNGSFLKGQKLAPIMPINEKKKQFLNESKVLNYIESQMRF